MNGQVPQSCQERNMLINEIEKKNAVGGHFDKSTILGSKRRKESSSERDTQPEERRPPQNPSIRYQMRTH
jgi:hypothetical protein